MLHMRSLFIGHTARAFTMIELMVVVAVILILLTIGGFVATTSAGAGEEMATRSILSRGKAIADEYEVRAEQVVPHLASFWSGNRDYNTPGTAGSGPLGLSGEANFQVQSIERFIWATLQINSIREQYYAAMSETELIDSDGNGFLELRDGWDNKIVYAQAVVHDDDGDGNINDSEGAADEDDFLPAHNVPLFASAGPDGKFGSHKQLFRQLNGDSLNATERQEAEDAADNVYSFDLDR